MDNRKLRTRMPREERAKQFMPFAALKGFELALREKERAIVSRRVLSEDHQEELDLKLRQIRENDIITVVYFQQDEYVKITGMVSRVDKTARILKIVHTQIAFADIYEIYL